MLRGKMTLFMDQYGRCVHARTLRELHAQIPGRIAKMYCDDKSGRTFHVGYVVGSYWLTAFSPVRIPQN